MTTVETPLFADSKYAQLAATHAAAYQGAEPFPHIMIDDFLDPKVCEEILRLYPGESDIPWTKFDRPVDLKLASNDDARFAAFVRAVMLEFNSSQFIRFLEGLTGIQGLVGDPWFEGGGLHQIPRGGFLKIHADFNLHQKLKLDRRINVLLYLNRDWKEEYKGHLELWDREMQGCRRKILPVFNRCVVFNTTSDAFHGHPEPLTCPEGRTRKSLAFYYYTSGRPDTERRDAHNTLYLTKRDELGVGRKLRLMAADTMNSLAKAAELPARALRRAASHLEFR